MCLSFDNVKLTDQLQLLGIKVTSDSDLLAPQLAEFLAIVSLAIIMACRLAFQICEK
ncbi:hypothetical protein GLYMA_18G236900v4 [Glycine max]|uniref:Uncharacterized protein n=2 Tax=Glycine subgen. Soja TaxID=1462606 RepID=K7MUD2_SOYBN|nr:hypothetical protein JHK87_051150 [Glycine soja]KAH1155878.1 hypothetical protein GYH30_050922 [Glycine max]KHM99337.1 hypothetical protein glysoja_028794 [Glycine soja]KRH00835.1 hypothetical protein GLYMA_18G236900v4 [Glycine max]